jgi:hypothetical protein
MTTDTLFVQVGLLVAINVGILATALVSAWRDVQRRSGPAQPGARPRRRIIGSNSAAR